MAKLNIAQIQLNEANGGQKRPLLAFCIAIYVHVFIAFLPLPSAHAQSFWEQINSRQVSTIWDYLKLVSDISTFGNTTSFRLKTDHDTRRVIHYVDIEVVGDTEIGTLVDPGSIAASENWKEQLKVELQNEATGKKTFRVYFHPEDTLYRDEFLNGIAKKQNHKVMYDSLEAATKNSVEDKWVLAQSDESLRFGIAGYASSSRSVYFHTVDQNGDYNILQLKAPTNYVNGDKVEGKKKYSSLEALWAIMASQFFRVQLPETLRQEPLAVKLNKSHAFLFRYFGKVKKSDLTSGNFFIWVPVHMFEKGSVDLFTENSMLSPARAIRLFELIHKHVFTSWKSELAKVILFRTIETQSMHSQNGVVKLYPRELNLFGDERITAEKALAVFKSQADVEKTNQIEASLIDGSEMRPSKQNFYKSVVALQISLQQAHDWGVHSSQAIRLSSKSILLSEGLLDFQKAFLEHMRGPLGQLSGAHARQYSIFLELLERILFYQQNQFSESAFEIWTNRFNKHITADERTIAFSEITILYQELKKKELIANNEYFAAKSLVGFMSYILSVTDTSNIKAADILGDTAIIDSLRDAFNLLKAEDYSDLRINFGENAYKRISQLYLIYINNNFGSDDILQNNIRFADLKKHNLTIKLIANLPNDILTTFVSQIVPEILTTVLNKIVGHLQYQDPQAEQALMKLYLILNSTKSDLYNNWYHSLSLQSKKIVDQVISNGCQDSGFSVVPK